MEFGISRSKRAPYVSSYLPPYLSVYADPCRALRRHLRLLLNLNLNLNLNLALNLNLYLNLNLFLFQPSFEKPFAASFDSLFVLKYRPL